MVKAAQQPELRELMLISENTFFCQCQASSSRLFTPLISKKTLSVQSWAFLDHFSLHTDLYRDNSIIRAFSSLYICIPNQINLFCLLLYHCSIKCKTQCYFTSNVFRLWVVHSCICLGLCWGKGHTTKFHVSPSGGDWN